MGRRSRHSAKTGDQSIYKNRSKHESSTRDDDDDDPMYNDVERYHNRKEEEEYLQLDADADIGDESSDEDDGITKHQEGVFDLGVGGSSDEEDDDDEEDSDSEDEREKARAKRKRVEAMEAALASSSDDDDDSDDEDQADGEGGTGKKSSRLLNWGDKKQAYYHGDTADLEIGQDVEDAYLEEEAGREVEKARLDGMDDADFMLDGEAEDDVPEEEETSKSKKKKRRKDEGVETIQSAKRPKQLSKLSKKEKMKLLKTNHPELLPLVQHFSGPIRELSETTMVAAGALLKNGVKKGGKEAEAVGATPAGLQYLITKSMLQASKALNLSLYLLLKSDQASSKNISMDKDNMQLMEEDEGDDIRNHPVMDRLNQLSQLTDKLQEGVEDKASGLKEQMSSLVKAATLMAGGDLSSSDESDAGSDDEEDDQETESSEIQDAAALSMEQAGIADNVDKSDKSSSDSEDEGEASQAAIQRRIMTEAKFAVRNQDIDNDVKKSSKKQRKRRLAPSSSDYGDETEEITDKTLEASRKLASTMNSIVQKSNTSNNRKKKAMGDEEEGDEDEYDRLQRGLSMMDEEFGMKGSDVDDEEDEDEGLHDSDDEDDFYQKIKSKSRSKKEAKKQMYAVAPKYPRLEGEVEGERAIGRTIMKNRGLVAHKAKINRNPRVKKREQYRKALIRRRGAVREVRDPNEGYAYGGEGTGIKSGISRSRKLASR
jgi:U3 small nucleolar RNA-associated protein 3